MGEKSIKTKNILELVEYHHHTKALNIHFSSNISRIASN